MSKEPQIIASLDIETGQGAFLAHYSKDGLAALDFPSGRARPASNQGEGKAPTLQVERWHEIAVAALVDTLNGKSPRQLPPLDWVGGFVQDPGGKNADLRRHRLRLGQTPRRPGGGGGMRGESDSGARAVPPGGGGGRRFGRLLRRSGMEAKAAQTRTNH